MYQGPGNETCGSRVAITPAVLVCALAHCSSGTKIRCMLFGPLNSKRVAL